MTKLSISLFTPLLLIGVIAIMSSSCTMLDNKDLKTAYSYGTCEGCHTDYAHLKLVYSPDTAAPAGGCGGEAPHYEPYDRVFMGGSNYEAYKLTTHGGMECTDCHNGKEYEHEKDKAHSGDFLRHPSAEWEEKCLKCHRDDVSGYATSLHHGIGQKNKVTKRSGLAGYEEFDQLAHEKIEGYNANCATCHGTCGSCHVVRPKIAGGGLAMSHVFTKTPNMRDVCVSCHTSRGGHAFYGWDEDAEPDVHKTAGFTCLNCHDKMEIHGNGEPVSHRYEYTELPTCSTCHQEDIDDTGNLYHNVHKEDFNCQVCHSQNYNTCGSCHIHGDGARFGPIQDFKIALNPLGDEDIPGHDYEYSLVRRTLGAPDNWDVYVDDDYTNFDAFPIYNYTTPHNIQEITSRTIEGAGVSTCMLNCHIRNEGGNLINSELYLLDEVLTETWMQTSTGHITVDDALPQSWFAPQGPKK